MGILWTDVESCCHVLIATAWGWFCLECFVHVQGLLPLVCAHTPQP